MAITAARMLALLAAIEDYRETLDATRNAIANSYTEALAAPYLDQAQAAFDNLMTRTRNLTVNPQTLETETIERRHWQTHYYGNRLVKSRKPGRKLADNFDRPVPEGFLDRLNPVYDRPFANLHTQAPTVPSPDSSEGRSDSPEGMSEGPPEGPKDENNFFP